MDDRMWTYGIFDDLTGVIRDAFESYNDGMKKGCGC